MFDNHFKPDYDYLQYLCSVPHFLLYITKLLSILVWEN